MQSTLNCVSLLLLLLVQSACTTLNEDEEAMKVYRSGIGEMINSYLYKRCIGRNAELDKLYKDSFLNRQKVNRFLQLLDSLTDVRKSFGPKCVIAHSNRRGQIWGPGADQQLTVDDLKESIRYTIVNRGVADDFDDSSLLVEKLSTPSGIDPAILVTEYVDIVRYDRQDGQLPENVVGVVGFSKIAFDKNLSNALLYFEYYCGHQCWKGSLVYLSRKGDIWAIERIESVWDT